jgi:hypothetical protein
MAVARLFVMPRDDESLCAIFPPISFAAENPTRIFHGMIS